MTYLDMIGRLMCHSEYGRVANHNQIQSHQPLDPQIGVECTSCQILCTKLRFGMLMYFGELLLLLDYVVYTPFGERGTQMLIQRFGDLDGVKKYKRKVMVHALNEIGAEVGTTFRLRIETFIDYLYSPNQNLEAIESVVATTRIISGYLDNLVSKGEVIGLNERDKKLKDILDQIYKHTQETGSLKFDIRDFVPSAGEEPFNEEENKYFFVIDVE